MNLMGVRDVEPRRKRAANKVPTYAIQNYDGKGLRSKIAQYKTIAKGQGSDV